MRTLGIAWARRARRSCLSLILATRWVGPDAAPANQATRVTPTPDAASVASTVLTKAPQIVSSLQEFTQALNDKAGPKPEIVTETT